MGRGKYPNNSVEAYELIVNRSGIYQSNGIGDSGGGRENSNGRGNQQNQRRNVMFLQQDINREDSNICPPKDHIVPGKDGSTYSLE